MVKQSTGNANCPVKPIEQAKTEETAFANWQHSKSHSTKIRAAK
jgi:hypothetical protein